VSGLQKGATELMYKDFLPLPSFFLPATLRVQINCHSISRKTRADWAYRDSLFAYMGEAIQDAGPGGNQVWLILDLDRGADGKPNMESTILRAVYDSASASRPADASPSPY